MLVHMPVVCADVIISTDAKEACKGVDIAVMVGGFPRKGGMERKDVMAKNVAIYKGQAAALESGAKPDVKVMTPVACPSATSAFCRLRGFNHNQVSCSGSMHLSCVNQMHFTCSTTAPHHQKWSCYSKGVQVLSYAHDGCLGPCIHTSPVPGDASLLRMRFTTFPRP